MTEDKCENVGPKKSQHVKKKKEALAKDEKLRSIMNLVCEG